MVRSLPRGRTNDGSNSTTAQLMELLILRSVKTSATRSHKNKRVRQSPGIRTLANRVPEPRCLRRLSPTTDRRGGDNMEAGAQRVALRSMNHRPVLLVVTGLTKIRNDKDRRRLRLNLGGSAFAANLNRLMIRGFHTKLIEIQVRGSVDAQVRRYRRGWASAIVLRPALGASVA